MIGTFEGKIIAALVALVVAFGGGFALEHVLKNGEIAKINLANEQALNKSKDALAAANDANTALSRAATTANAAAAEAYEKGEHDANAKTDPLIADLRAGNRRLHVLVDRAASSGSVPGAGAAASGGDGTGQGTLARPVAARLAGRYADYNGLVRRLNLCQAVVRGDRRINAPN